MNPVLARWNSLRPIDASKEILPCCGSKAWADGMTNRRPISDETALLAASDEIWWSLSEADWLEAFRSHPRIGESRAHSGPVRSAKWSTEEQRQEFVTRLVASFNAAQSAWNTYREHLIKHGLLTP